MSTPTFQLLYVALPTEDSPQLATHGEASIVCWIVQPTLEEAEKIAVPYIEAQHYVILEQEYADVALREDYDPHEDDDLIQYFDQAQIDKDVYLFHESPRFSVYQVVARVCRTLDDGAREEADAHYMLANEHVGDEDSDFFDPAFWTPTRAATALARTGDIVADEGWTILHIAEHGPVDWRTADDELRGFCDHAEDDGECVIFVIDL